MFSREKLWGDPTVALQGLKGQQGTWGETFSEGLEFQKNGKWVQIDEGKFRLDTGKKFL